MKTGSGNRDIRPVVEGFFKALDFEGVRWAVLRGGDDLPDFARYDIDILLPTEQFDRAEMVLRRVASSLGWSVIRIVEKLDYRCCLLWKQNGNHIFLPIDLFGRCLHRFHPIANERVGLDGRRRNSNGVWVVPPGFGSALCILKELMRHSAFKENSREETLRGAVQDPDGFLAAVGGVLGTNLSKQLLSAARVGDWEGIAALAPRLRKRVRMHWWRRPWAAGRFFLKNIAHHWRPPMSCFVVLLGPDGTGKSTIAQRLVEDLSKKPFKVCRSFEYNFRILPRLGLVKEFARKAGFARDSKAPPIKPGSKGSGMNPDHGALRASIYILYYTLDLLLGWTWIARMRGQGGLVVFARYFHDYYFQRGYGNVPRALLKILEVVVPKPDCLVYLDRDAEEIYKGKPELEISEIRRQQGIIKKLLDGRKNAVIIDGSRGIEETCLAVKEVILGRFLGKHGVLYSGNDGTMRQGLGVE